MSIIILCLLLCLHLPMSVSAVEIEAPSLPNYVEETLPSSELSFGEGLFKIIEQTINGVAPDINEAIKTGMYLFIAVLICSTVKLFTGKDRIALDISACIFVAGVLFSDVNSMVTLGTNTITRISDYGKMLLPVMTSGLAAQGSVSASAAIYIGTAFFDAILGNLIAKLLVPLVYIYFAFAVVDCAVSEELLKKIKELIKQFVSWCLKILLTVFTTYISITGIVSGTTDAAVLKATKVSISTFVPVVGSILSEASEAVLISAGIAKNAAGIYGIFAIILIFLHPFLQIGMHYLTLKIASGACSVFGSKRITDLIADFSVGMGLILAMTGAVCLLFLISSVCFLKGAS